MYWSSAWRNDRSRSLQVAQRPAFLTENSIGDRVVFSGFVGAEALIAAIDALLNAQAAYGSWQAHSGDPLPL